MKRFCKQTSFRTSCIKDSFCIYSNQTRPLSILSCRNPSPIRLQSHEPAVRPPSPAAFTRPPRPRRRPPSPLLLGCSAAGPAGGSDRRVASPSPPAAAPLRDRPYRCLARVATTHRLFLSPAVVGRCSRAGRIPPPDQDVLRARRDRRRHESSSPASPLFRLPSPRLLSSLSSPQLSATPPRLLSPGRLEP